MASNYTSPGLKVRISQNGLDYAAQMAIDELTADLQGKPISDQQGNDRVSGGKVEYQILNTVIQSFAKPTSRVVVTPESGVTWSANGASIAVRGEWRYKYRWHMVKARDHGSFDVSASGVNFSVSITLGSDVNGKPTICASSCSSHVSNLNVKFHGGASWLYNIFDGQISRALKKKLEDVILSAARKLIDVDAARKLSQVNVLTDIGSGMVLDYGLVCPPVFSNGYLDTMHRAEVNWKENATRFDFVPKELPVDTDSSKMVYIWASEFVANSYANAAFSSGLLKAKLDQTDMPGGDNFLSPGGGQSGGEGNTPSFVEVELEATAPPEVKIKPSGINLTLSGNMTLKGRTPSTQLDYVFKVATVLEMDVNVWLEEEILKADVSDFKSEFNVLESQLGPLTLPGRMLEGIFGNLLNKFIHPKLKDLGQKGFDLPQIKGCKYVNHTIQLNEGNLLLAADVAWTG